jgi:hypothetical protein
MGTRTQDTEEDDAMGEGCSGIRRPPKWVVSLLIEYEVSVGLICPGGFGRSS